MSLNPLKQEGKIIVISAPSGAGKTTLVESVLKELSGHVVRTITCTTREPRATEVNGRDYWFITKEEFQAKKARGDFLEDAIVYGHSYGTDKSDVERLLKEKKDVILVIDVSGALYLMKEVNAVFIFICPPSLEELERRIRLRKTDSEEEIASRLAKAKFEMEKSVYYDYIMLNDDFHLACNALKSILIAEDFKNEEKKEVHD